MAWMVEAPGGADVVDNDHTRAGLVEAFNRGGRCRVSFPICEREIHG